MDDISNNNDAQNTAEIDQDKLAKLKAKLDAKKDTKVERSIKFGIIGSGQAGSRIAEAFYKLGYNSVVMNTASSDLKFIDIPESNKLHLNSGPNGAAKELSIGHSSAEAHREQIADLVTKQLVDSEMFIFCLSLGGGSGAGSCETIVDILNATGKPVIVITVLPMDTEDAQTKSNALTTLSKLAKFAQSKKIANLIVVDNAKIEAIYSNVSQLDFYGLANKVIVDPIDVFNRYSTYPSAVKPLDTTELIKILIDGEGLTVYGELKIHNYEDETAIAEGIISSLDSNLLASGFNIKESKYVGVMMIANKNVWGKIPSSSINYAMAILTENSGTPLNVHKGIYTSDDNDNFVKIYAMFSGLGLPVNRIEALKKETQLLSQTIQNKGEKRNLTLNLDLGKDETVSKVQEIKDKIASKSSAFGKFTGGNKVTDRRK